MKDGLKRFEGLRVYKATRQLVKDVYVLINKLPAIESFALSSQIRRAVVSVKSNIAEGSGRVSRKEKIHFLEISYGSLMEAYCQLQIALEVGYITDDDLARIKPLLFETSRLISGLRNSYSSND